ncbi:MAG: hypothetical protein LBS83_03435 [Holosporales bacterium]|nr:hypothetical protein [Holosporales bacterium]
MAFCIKAEDEKHIENNINTGSNVSFSIDSEESLYNNSINTICLHGIIYDSETNYSVFINDVEITPDQNQQFQIGKNDFYVICVTPSCIKIEYFDPKSLKTEDFLGKKEILLRVKQIFDIEHKKISYFGNNEFYR